MKKKKEFFRLGAFILLLFFVSLKFIYAQYGDDYSSETYGNEASQINPGDYYADDSKYYTNTTQNNPYGKSRDSRYLGNYSQQSVNNPYAPYNETYDLSGNVSKNPLKDTRDPRRIINNPYDTTSTIVPYGEFGSPYDPDRLYNPYADYKVSYSAPNDNNPFVSEVPLVFGNAATASKESETEI